MRSETKSRRSFSEGGKEKTEKKKMTLKQKIDCAAGIIATASFILYFADLAFLKTTFLVPICMTVAYLFVIYLVFLSKKLK